MTEITPKIHNIIALSYNKTTFYLDSKSLYYLAEKILYPEIQYTHISGNKIYTKNSNSKIFREQLDLLIKFVRQVDYHTFILKVPTVVAYYGNYNDRDYLIFEKVLDLLNLKFKRIDNTTYDYKITKKIYPSIELSEYFYTAYLSKESAEITLISNSGESFKIHRTVIQYYKIPYFVAAQNFNPNQDINEIYKLDYSSPTLSSFIDYLYWGSRKWIEHYQKAQLRQIPHTSPKYEKSPIFEDLLLLCDYLNYEEFFNVLTSLHPKRVISLGIFQESQLNNKYFQDVLNTKVLTLEDYTNISSNSIKLLFIEPVELIPLTVTNTTFSSKISGCDEGNLLSFRYKLDPESKTVVYLFYRDNPFCRNRLDVILFQDRKCIGPENSKFKVFLCKLIGGITVFSMKGYMYENYFVNSVASELTMTYKPDYFYSDDRLNVLENHIYFQKPIENLEFLVEMNLTENKNNISRIVRYWHFRALTEHFNLYVRMKYSIKCYMIEFVAFQSKSGNRLANKIVNEYLKDYFPEKLINIMENEYNYTSSEKAYLKRHNMIEYYRREKKELNEETI